MKAYWDSSALVLATADIELRRRLHQERGITRTHALGEVFSTLTGGNLALRMEADTAAQTVQNLAQDLDFTDLEPREVLAALKQARRRGVRGGRVHDFLHAAAAEKAKIQELLTTDEHDFNGLTDSVKVQLV
jgi:predicted nucleic acid-binding protein